MTKDEALKLALEALERCVATCFDPYAHEQAMSWPEHFVNQTITAIKEALAQPKSEYERGFIDGMQKQMQSSVDKAVNAMTQPTYYIPNKEERTWVGLTQEEIEDSYNADYKAQTRAIEAKLKERNS